jgi:signal transduction histidine kinase
LKLHTKTTLLISAVLIVVFAVIAYIYDSYTTTITDNSEHQRAELFASRVADTVEEHIKLQRKKGREHAADEESFEPDWAEIQDVINGTIMKDNSQGNSHVSEVRIFRSMDRGEWEEAVRLPEDAGPPFFRPPPSNEPTKLDSHGNDRPNGFLRLDQGPTTLIRSMARVYSPSENGSPKMIATATILLAIDENASLAARIRRLIWPLMLLAIVAITLVTYFLFRHIIYTPIDKLLVAMSKAEAGDLAGEVEPSAADEIGLLTSRFNRMLGRIRAVTDELNRHQRGLEGRVTQATAEIAERKAQLEDANLELFEMQRQLTQLERLAAAGQLAAQFAHEVGTPLNLISGHVQLLRARANDERVIKRLDIIGGQIERITNIVRSMLDSTRKPKPHLELIDINSLLARILDATQPTLSARGVELQITMAKGPLCVHADADQLQQVFINLINNSLDAMPEGGVLHTSAARLDEWVVIEISDSGEGIRGDQLDLIFDPLFTTKHGRGTGLGLTIVKQIISEHGGAVEAESEPGHGTLFKIKLPVAEAAEASDLHIKGHAVLTHAAHNADLSPDGEPVELNR